MNEGKIFEHDLEKSIPKDVYFQRINDPAQSFGASSGLRFSPKNRFDFIAYQFPYFYALELKSTKENSMSFQRSEDDTQSMIKWSQIQALQEASKFKGTICGFLLNFRSCNETYFVFIDDFINWMTSQSKKSFNKNDILLNPHIKIEQELLRVHYRYNISKFMSDAVEMYNTKRGD